MQKNCMSNWPLIYSGITIFLKMLLILDFISIERKGQIHNSTDISSSVQLRAELFQGALPSKFPSFVKCMLRSHVTGGFWLVREVSS